jgi:hypothetical protein
MLTKSVFVFMNPGYKEYNAKVKYKVLQYILIS